MSYHDVLFPIDIAYGSAGGPRFNTTVTTLASGYERRNINWSEVRAEYNVAHGVKTREQMEDLLAFFYARQGRGYSFRFFDHLDYQIANQIVGTGNGSQTVFQIKKTYQNSAPDVGLVYTYDRRITKPRRGTFETNGTSNVLINNVPVPFDNSGPIAPGTCRIDYTTGKITFGTAPRSDQEIKISYGEFDVHCRFDTDWFDPTHDFWETMSWPNIPIVEVKEKLA